MEPEYTVRHARREDLTEILLLSNSEKSWVGECDRSFFEAFLNLPFFWSVVNPEGIIVGFILAMQPDTDYDSNNFLWFKERYKNFIYIDRVVVSPAYRREGIATHLYDLLMDQRIRTNLACEIAVEPICNFDSLRLHRNLGFREVGRYTAPSGKVNSMQFHDFD